MLMFYILLSVAVSFLCSMLEAIILSATPTYLSALKTQNPKLYKKTAYIKEDIEKPLASILTFNTIAHTIGAAGAGAEAQKLWGNEYLSIFSAVLTFIILFFSEIIPKSIGARSWKVLLPYCHLILRPMIIASLPIVWLSLKISKMIKGDAQDTISRDEIPAMAEMGLNSGVIKKSEYNRLKSFLYFNDIQLREVLKPAQEVAGVPFNFSIHDALEEIKDNTFSRLMVFKPDSKIEDGYIQDCVQGYVMRKDILQSAIDKDDKTVKDITRNVLIIQDTTSGQEMFDKLLAIKAHIAAVIDDQGTFLGIVTLEDLIETLTGTKIYDEYDEN